MPASVLEQMGYRYSWMNQTQLKLKREKEQIAKKRKKILSTFNAAVVQDIDGSDRFDRGQIKNDIHQDFSQPISLMENKEHTKPEKTVEPVASQQQSSYRRPKYLFEALVALTFLLASLYNRKGQFFNDEKTPKLLLASRLKDIERACDTGFRAFIEDQFANNLFSNPYIDKVTAKALYELTLVPEYQKLIVDLLILMYSQEGFNNDVRRLTSNIIEDYLISEQGENDLASITIDLALRDDKYTQPGIQKLLMDYLRGPDSPYLEQLSGKTLMNIGWNPYIKDGIHDAMVNQMRDKLNRDPILYDLAIANCLMTLGVYNE